MNFNKQPDRIKKMHRLIQTETTGSPEQFAQQLHLSRRQLYNELERLKELDAPIKYCKKKTSFYYTQAFDLELNYSLKTIKGDEIRKIFGGSYFRAMKLHGSLIHLSYTNDVLEKTILY
jgi:hypothetical protein